MSRRRQRWLDSESKVTQEKSEKFSSIAPAAFHVGHVSAASIILNIQQNELKAIKLIFYEWWQFA